MADNLRLYNKFKGVPDNAKKPISGGRLKGFTDISPIWRIKTLTEAFGPCGIGWNVRCTGYRTESNEDVGETAVFVDIELIYRETPDSDWSAPVFGTGGAKLSIIEKEGIRFDDEAYKKAYTDAISVACKSLGIGADVYWDRDTDKYSYGERTEEALSLIEEIFSYGTANDINAISVKSKGRMVDQLNDDELKKLAEFLRAKKKPDAEKQPESDARKAEIVKVRTILLNLSKTSGIDERTMRMRAEAFVEEHEGVFVKFDDMTLEQLITLKVNFTAAFKDADQVS